MTKGRAFNSKFKAKVVEVCYLDMSRGLESLLLFLELREYHLPAPLCYAESG
jgi:hypothetical protein